jgi:hypothetical protein
MSSWVILITTACLERQHRIDNEIGSEPKDHDAMRMNAWLTIARETIIDQLTNKCGLQLKLSANSSHIFCRIRAPIKLLELQADNDGYCLQFRGEVLFPIPAAGSTTGRLTAFLEQDRSRQ